MSNMQYESFLSAIEQSNVELVREILGNGIKVNASGPRGTALYRAIKLHNFEILKLLIENGADCNIVQLDFDRNEQHPEDGYVHCCFISTPIDFLCDDYNASNDVLLQYLLENRPIISKDLVDQRIRYCTQLFDNESSEIMFDYAASYFLRKNMYDHLLRMGKNAFLSMIVALLNLDAKSPNKPDKPLVNGGTHQAFFTLLIRSLFEELVRFKLNKSSHITSKADYDHILCELLHNLEAYNLLMDINRLPATRVELHYPFMRKNIIKKLKTLKIKDEYTLPAKWEGHALCLNFVGESNSIAIRIDNLNIGEINEHTSYKDEKDFIVMIPKIVGEIPFDKLDHCEEYFESLLTCMKGSPLKRKDGLARLYQNDKLKNVSISRVSMLTDQLIEKARTVKCFIQQADSNCFIKSHEPGFVIRTKDPNSSQKILTIMATYATKFKEADIVRKRNDLERQLKLFWEKETTIS